MSDGQLDLFESEKTHIKIKCPWILFDIGIDNNIWRGVISNDEQHLVMYRGREGETQTYDPVSGCHIVSMPSGLNLVDVVKNVQIGEHFINDGKSRNESVRITNGSVDFKEAEL